VGQRWPFLSFFGLVILSNAAGSVFSILYNDHLIVQRYMDDAQKNVFHHIATPAYNMVAYPACLGLMLYLLWPLVRCFHRLHAGAPIPPAEMSLCRRRVVNLPFLQVCVNSLGWLPGAIVFPLLICALGSTHAAIDIWRQFVLSFMVSAGLTTMQTFFLMEAFLVRVLYPYFFQDARPTEVEGVVRIPFGVRLWGLWMAVAVMPLVALLLVALQGRGDGTLALIVACIGGLSGGVIFHFARADVMQWVRQHFRATEEISRGRFEYRIPEKRPDEWGRLNDRFNDMAAALAQGQKEHETFGQMVGAEVRDLLMDRYPGLAGDIQEITVLFADIRGFTRRSAGEAPERIVALLNRFFTLAVRAVQNRGGHVNKFLGDGIMALFGATKPQPDHADLAVLAAQDLLERLGRLNEELAEFRQPTLAIGIGIHTGPAVVGCIGATLDGVDGRQEVRKEFTAIGETVNLCQRIEQLTKLCGGPILLSETTRLRLRLPVVLSDLGPQTLAGYTETIVIYQVSEGDNGASHAYR
jgi:adenylate cyclase